MIYACKTYFVSGGEGGVGVGCDCGCFFFLFTVYDFDLGSTLFRNFAAFPSSISVSIPMFLNLGSSN